MDFQAVVDGMSAMTCVVSVEDLPGGRYGKFRIVTGNKAYIDSIEHPAPGTEMLKDKFVPNSEYTDYLTRDLNFEDFCYRAAVKRKCLHSYAHPDRMNVWFNMSFIPLDARDGNLCYCLYIMEINFEADSENFSTASGDTASAVLDMCIRLRGTNDFKSTMGDVVAGLRKLCEAEHCCILAVDEYERTCSVIGEAFAPGSMLLPMENYIDDDFFEIADSWKATIAGSNCIIAKNDRDMEIVRERNPVWYESLTSAGASNIVLFPLKSRNQLLGYMWVLNFNPELSVKIKETLEVATFILGSELGNYLLLDRLKLLGSKDMLTGVKNRNEMNNLVDELSRGTGDGKSVGVIFADLNGLKTVNDVNGHNAGDMLLKNAAEALRSAFSDRDIFRAGGDEFAVIVTDVTEEEIDEKIDKIRKECFKYNDLSFALGGCVESNSSNVRMALRRADERMYADKQKYYEQFPERVAEGRRSRARNTEIPAEQVRENNILFEMNYDSLTGLPSMTHFFRLAESARSKMHEEGIESALVFLNMNGLRGFNQRYGFAEGDLLIKEFAHIIITQFGRDNVSRFGQDHFAVYTESEGLEQKIEKIFKEMKSANKGKTLLVRAGIYPDSMGIVETSLACDRASYACDAIRDDNRSYFNYYDKNMLQHELNREYVIENIDRAISENWIVAYYQPIVRATSRKVCDEEALARWIDPVKGMMSPAEFIPVLEDTKLIYKVDLYMVELILERIKKQMLSEIANAVPVSINLSRTDFEMCDIVEEICNRVDAANVPRELLTIEITESVIGQDLEFMKEQIRRFRDLGFQVWMDDFGSGYSSLDLLQEMQFDVIKFDMKFMKQLDSSPKSRVLLTELMRMAISLNIETVTEGVETAEQVDFLSEIGCTKMQGYYFTKPISYEDIMKRYRDGKQIGFEDPDESGYHKVLSSINLYDLDAVSNNDSSTVKHYFNTIPMAIVESDGYSVSTIRCNKSFREFAGNNPMLKESFPAGIRQCRSIGQKQLLSEKTDSGETANILIRRIIDNPLTGKGAFAVAVLDVTTGESSAITYTSVAKALFSDFIDLYHVDLETGRYTQYSPDPEHDDIMAEQNGDNFFETATRDALERIQEDDQVAFVMAFNRKNIEKSLDEYGAFTHTYRLYFDDRPQYVNMKAVRTGEDKDHIIIAVSNVDAQMRQQEVLDRLKEETTTYSRISALIGDFIAIYTVDPETNNYMQYSASNEFSSLGTPKFGMDFYADSRNEIEDKIFPDDYDTFMEEFTRENILEKTADGDVFMLNYRLIMSGRPVDITLRAGLVKEKDGLKLIVGVAKH